MIVQWVFRRGDARAVIDIVRTDRYYVVHVREPKGERWLTVATVLDALLEEADVERALTCGGWYLTDFYRPPMAVKTRSHSDGCGAGRRGCAAAHGTLSVGHE